MIYIIIAITHAANQKDIIKRAILTLKMDTFRN